MYGIKMDHEFSECKKRLGAKGETPEGRYPAHRQLSARPTPLVACSFKLAP